MNKYYRKEYRAVVLSESPDDDRLESLDFNVTIGDDCLHSFECVNTDELDGMQIAKLLYDAGSDPGFFGLNDDGEKVNQ